MNIDIGTPQKIVQILYSAFCTNNSSMGIDIYGSNDTAQFNIPYDVSNLTMLTKLNSSQYSFTNNQKGTIYLKTTVSFRYYIFVGTVLSTPNDLMLELTFQYQQTGIAKLDNNSNIP